LTFAHDPAHPASPLLTGNRVFLLAMGGVFAAWGLYAVSLLLRDPDALASTENHPAWKHMYMILMAAQVGFALAYIL